MPCVRQSFAKQFNLSEGALDVLMSSWSEGTSKQYTPHLRRWFSFCSENELDPFAFNVKNGAEFLTIYFELSKCNYSSMNTARSALSSFIPANNGIRFGDHPLIKRLLRGMFKQRPSLPRYTVTYDVKGVLDYIKQYTISEEMSLESLSKYLATLMCLLSGQRSQTLASLSKDYMHIDDNRCIFYIPELLKTSRPNFHQEPLEFKSYPHDISLCVVRLINLYLEKTAMFRKKEMSPFFISYAAPYKPVSSKTLARWVLDILKKSGINIKTFKTHSIRSASTSSVYQAGLSLVEIGKAAGWSSSRTFARFYNKHIDENFGTVLLDRNS